MVLDRTILDSLLSGYARKRNKDKEKNNWMIKVIRFMLWAGTGIGQTLCLREEMLPMITET